MKLLGNREVVRNLPTLAEAVELAAEVYAQGPDEGLELPPKVAVHPREESFVHAMPCYLGGADLLGLKWIGGFERNRERGLPYISGILVLNDPETGFPTAILDAAPITVARTVAASAVCLYEWGARRPHTGPIGIVGCGVQGAAHARAFSQLVPGAHVAAYDPDSGRARSLGIDAEALAEPRHAFAGTAVVVTAAPMRGPGTSARLGAELFDTDDWLTLALDMDASLAPSIADAADLFTVDDLGQYEFYRDAGYFAGWRAPDCSVADLLAGRVEPGRRTLAVNLGVASLDLAFGAWVLARAEGVGDGVEVPMFVGD